MVAGSEGERWPRKSEEWWGACGSAECHLIEKGLTTDEDGEVEVGGDATVRVRARVRLGSRRDTRKGVVTKVGNEVKKYGWRAKTGRIQTGPWLHLTLPALAGRN